MELQAGVEERHHLEPLDQGLGAVLNALFEDGRVRPEPHGGAGAGIAILVEGRVTDFGELGVRFAAVLEGHGVTLALTVNLDFDLCGQRVHHGDAHAVETAGDLVATVAELATGVQHGQHNLGRGQIFVLWMASDRDAAPIINNLNTAILQNRHIYAVAVSRHRLVHSVIHNLPHEVVEAGGAGRADIHARSLADRFQSFKDLNGRCAVGIVRALRIALRVRCHAEINVPFSRRIRPMRLARAVLESRWDPVLFRRFQSTS